MENALIVSSAEKGTEFFSEKLLEASVPKIIAVKSCGEARRVLLDRDFDLVIVNAPLRDETGENFARHVAASCISQVILAVKSEHFDAVSAICEDDGVLTIAKPVNKPVFWSALKLAIAAQGRVRRMHSENSKLKQKLEDIKVIDRAKCVLISRLSMNEEEAHKYIEKQSMDMRLSKREIAENLLKSQALA